jgi:hypothetical protein
MDNLTNEPDPIVPATATEPENEPSKDAVVQLKRSGEPKKDRSGLVEFAGESADAALELASYGNTGMLHVAAGVGRGAIRVAAVAAEGIGQIAVAAAETVGEVAGAAASGIGDVAGAAAEGIGGAAEGCAGCSLVVLLGGVTTLSLMGWGVFALVA